MQDRRAVRSSETTSGHVLLPNQQTITLRKSLTQEELLQRRNTKTRDYALQDTIHLQQPQIPTKEVKNPKVYSEIQFMFLMFFIGFVLTVILITAGQYANYWVTYDLEHYRYGQDPMTHISGQFGLPGESKSKQSYAAALNQNGDITVIVVPPDASQTRVYVLTSSYQTFSDDVVPYIHQDLLQGNQALKVTVGDLQWYLVRHGNTFVQAQEQ